MVLHYIRFRNSVSQMYHALHYTEGKPFSFGKLNESSTLLIYFALDFDVMNCMELTLEYEELA
jgi:hypothetical protein